MSLRCTVVVACLIVMVCRLVGSSTGVVKHVSITSLDFKPNGQSILHSIHIHAAYIDEQLMRDTQLKGNSPHLLDMTANHFHDGTMRAISTYVKSASSLQTIILDGNPVGLFATGIKSLVQVARRHPKLNCISLSGCKLSNSHMKPLAYLLRTDKNITKLDLSANEISCEGLQSLLRSDGPLLTECLDLSYNTIGSDGVAVISEMLMSNKLPHLISLKLKQVGADLASITQLLSSIPASSPLQHIDLSGNRLFGKCADPEWSYYSYSGGAAAKKLKGFLPSALASAFDVAMDSVNTHLLYTGEDEGAAQTKPGRASVKSPTLPRPRKKLSVRSSKLTSPRRRGNRKVKASALMDSSGKHEHIGAKGPSSKFSTTSKASKKQRVTSTEQPQDPQRAFAQALVDFASNRLALSTSKPTASALLDVDNVDAVWEEDATSTGASMPSMPVLYVGLARTGVSDSFVQDLTRAVTALSKAAPRRKHGQVQAVSEEGVAVGDHVATYNTEVERCGEQGMRLFLDCELNDLSDSSVRAIANASLALQAASPSFATSP